MFSIQNTVRAIYLVNNSALDIQDLHLFNTMYCKNVNLEEFDRIQTFQLNNVSVNGFIYWMNELIYFIPKTNICTYNKLTNTK